MVSYTADTSTWYNWNTSSTSTCYTNNQIWNTWVNSSSTSTVSSATSDTSTSDCVWYNWVTSNKVPNPIRNNEIRQERYRTQKDQIEKKKKAEEKALELLLDLIGKEQLEIYKKTGRLFVKGNKYDYIIQKSGFIKRVEKDKITDLCVHLSNRYKFPDTDNVIAMKLALEIDEDLVLKKANIHGFEKRTNKLPEAACM